MTHLVVPSISVSRDIPASAPAIFAVLANPAMHSQIDGTGMAQSAADDVAITKVGDIFVMHMTHWDRGDYGMENHVVEFVPDRRIVWEPFAATFQRPEYENDEKVSETRYWGWELEPLEANLTRVTEFFDGSRLSDGLREFLKDGEFWRKGMTDSLENLERLVTTPAASSEIPMSDLTIDMPTKPKNYYEEVHRTS